MISHLLYTKTRIKKLGILSGVISVFLFQNLQATEQTVRRSFYSEYTGDSVSCQIQLPESYTRFEEQTYPVLYLLDGNLNFDLATSEVKILSRGIQPFIPEMIVVGITSSNRLRDFTPTQSKYHNNGIPTPPPYRVSGQANLFTEFLGKELKPYLDQTYRTNGCNILFGHSLGGIYGLNVLLYRQSFFNAFILVDPSIWWDNMKLLTEADVCLQEPFGNQTVYHVFANTTTIPPGVDTTLQIEGNKLLAAKFMKQTGSNLHFKSQFYAEETHGTVVIPALHDALKYVFRGYFVNPKKKSFTTNDLETSVKQVSYNLGVSFSPQASFIEAVARYCSTFLNDPDKATDFYKLGLRYYPENKTLKEGLTKLAKTQTSTSIKKE